MDYRHFIKDLITKSIYPTLQNLNKSLGDRIVRAIQSKESPTAFEITNQDEISSPIVEALSEAKNATVGAIQAIPRVDIPEADYSTLETKLDELKQALIEKNMSVNVGKTKVDVDTKSVVKAIEKLEKSLPKLEQQEVIDYTMIFSEMMDIMERPVDHTHSIEMKALLAKVAKTDDIAVLAEYLQTLIDKPIAEFPELPVDDYGRIKVAVDKVGGGGGGLTQIESEKLQTLATESTLQALVAASGGAGYALVKSAYDANDNIEYRGSNTSATASDSDTDWSIVKYVYSGDNLDYKITKTGSWTNRVSLF